MNQVLHPDDFEDATQVYDGEYPMSVAAKQDIQVMPPNTAVTPSDMLSQAVERGASLEVIEKMMGLQERWEKNQARKAFDEAVASAKAEIKPVERNREGHNKKMYADFAAIAKAVDPIITKHGLSYRFRTEQSDRINVTCVLSHRLGHSEETTLSGPPDASGSKNAIQAIGSTLTYLQRYALVQMLGIAVGDDDDGSAAKGNEAVTQEQADEIKALIARVGADIPKFLTAFQIEKVEDLRVSKFEEAKTRLNNYGKRK